MNSRPDPESESDLTSRARIRNAALSEFAIHGFKGASIRGIAKRAGVSPGLVQHFFGSKEALQLACDSYVFDTLRSARARTVSVDASLRPEYFATLFAQMDPIVAYLTTSLTSGSDVAAHWFDDIVTYMGEVLGSGDAGPAIRPEDDPRAVAAVQAAMGLGLTMLFDQVRRVLGDSASEDEFMLRVARAKLYLASERIVGEDTRRRLEVGLDRFAQTLDPPGHSHSQTESRESPRSSPQSAAEVREGE